MTGRGLGWCSGSDTPGYAGDAPGRGLGLGFGRRGGGWRGRGRFWPGRMLGWGRRWGPPPAPSRSQELADLQAQASYLEGVLQSVRTRLEALGKPESDQAG